MRGVAQLVRRLGCRIACRLNRLLATQCRDFSTSGRRRSTWPASVSTSLPSTSICTEVTAGRFDGERVDDGVDRQQLVQRAAGMRRATISRLKSTYASPARRDEHARAASSRRNRRHERLGDRRDLRGDDLARLLDGAFAVGDVALDAGQPHAVVGDVEQPRLDLAAGRRRARPATARRPRAAWRATSRGSRRTAPARRDRGDDHDSGDDGDAAAHQRVPPAGERRRGTARPRRTAPATTVFWKLVAGEQLRLVGVGQDSRSRRAPPACSPTRARAAARDRSARDASGTRSLELLLAAAPANAVGSIEVAGLREVPRHELDVARAAAEGRQPLGAAGGGASAPRPCRTRRRRSRRPTSPAASTPLTCRLMNRSALLLLASDVRSSIGTLRSSSRVSSTRRPRRASMTPFSRRATASVRSFSFAPSAPFDALVVAAVAGIDRDRADRRRRLTERRRHLGRRRLRLRAVAAAPAAGVAVSRRREEIDHQTRRRVARLRRRIGIRRTAAPDRRRASSRRRARTAWTRPAARAAESPGLGASSASASNLIER